MKNLCLKILWQNKTNIKIKQKQWQKLIKAIFKKKRLTGKIEIGILMVGKAKMQQLNYQFRKINQPTDVLSFPQLQIPNSSIINLGDIVICPPIAQKNALRYQKSLKEELLFLTEHGLKHLLGENH